MEDGAGSRSSILYPLSSLSHSLGQNAPSRILIVKPSAIGDVVHALPILNLLRKQWPGSHISWMVTPGCAGILEGHPQLDELILFDRKRLGRGWRSGRILGELYSFSRALREKQFDLVIDLQGLFRSGWFAWISGAGTRVGLSDAREAAPLFYTHVVPVRTKEQHAIDRYLSVVEALGCGRGPVEYVFPVKADDRAAVDRLIPQGTRYAVLHPGTNWPTKRWPVEKFAELVPMLRERFGLESVIAGAADLTATAQSIGGIDLTGRTTLLQLVALLERADLVVSNDSGPMHIAAALGRPLVAPFGPTNPVRTGPYGRMRGVVRLDIPCSPCYSRRCSHQSCLQKLDSTMVMDAVMRQLKD